MKRLRLLMSVLLVSLLVVSLAAQTSSLPKFKKGENYASVRTKMLKAGWKPYHSKDADPCDRSDTRCYGRPEMVTCSGTGRAFCKFLWKKNGKIVGINTQGEDPNEFDSIDK